MVYKVSVFFDAGALLAAPLSPSQVRFAAFLPLEASVEWGYAAGGGVGYPFSQRRKRGPAQSLDG